ncbi:glycoside hydrolase family 127 protein [Heyndrickxia coagulans]|uniref:glycoside hydrolase family 127 protein n=1 Tax=Heyndrickxia coagulans TaxID=1398 RepID=UPI0008F90F04|nr:beta-L-arabinofuranosidase domain-containing protein [Heyndrickxia coagulans]APB36847.1 hypothetical protein BIZ35_08450 [Heyndrickxia coagulans]QPG52649.1 glycoside hydrolase family 127 protein [Heyndrickxia coagulans]WNE60670.1 glycoside hydrolase family 127 protein [Heyndrickxia coagulans]
MPFKPVTITDSFWKKRMEIVKDEVIPYQWAALNDQIPDAPVSHAIQNFKIAAEEEEGEFTGMVFQDSDIMKWIEAVSYLLESFPDPELEKRVDELIDLFGRAQKEDGYLNTYFTVKEPDKRWTNLRDCHELYCAGHMIEAAVAYYEATKKEKFLHIVCKYADYIDRVFGHGEGKIPGFPGHQEIELALLKLYQETGNERYLNLSKYFIDERGAQPHYFDIEKEKRQETGEYFWHDPEWGPYSYHQVHLPVRDQKVAVGHCVRAVYMYTAMAGLAKLTGDPELLKACETLWENVTNKQMYITGGLGSQSYGESFSFDYDLPNDVSYTETCASVGLVFWARNMVELDVDRKYTDIMEKALYNGTISGMDLDGKNFFYVNPLEVYPKAIEKRKDHEHVKPVRQKWYTCACCPPNLARMISSIGRYIYSEKERNLFVHLFIGSETEREIAGKKVKIRQHTNYPWDGNIQLNIETEESVEFTIAVRIPSWCKNAIVRINGEEVALQSCIRKGYAYLSRKWHHDLIELNLEMKVERIRANPHVRENIGKVALQHGPVIYCLEEADNGAGLHQIILPRKSGFTVEYHDDLLHGVNVVTAKGYKIKQDTWNNSLYAPKEYEVAETTIKAVPYYAWCNRTPGEMMVWIHES